MQNVKPAEYINFMDKLLIINDTLLLKIKVAISSQHEASLW